MKVIDNVLKQQFNQFNFPLIGLFWGEVGEQVFWKKELTASGDPLLIKLLDRLIVENNFSERLEYIPQGRYARYIKVCTLIDLFGEVSFY